MNLAASFVAHCVSGLSCPTYIVSTSDLHCCVSCSSRRSARSPTVFDLGATVTFHFVCSELFLAAETKPVSHCQCVFRILRPEKTFSVLSHLPVQEFHRCQKTRADAFTNFHLEQFTHHCSRSSALSSGMQEMKPSRQCTPMLPALRPSINTAPPHFSENQWSLSPSSTHVANT